MAWEPNPTEADLMRQFVLGQGQGAPANPLAPTFNMQQYQTFGQPMAMSEDELDYNKDMGNYLQDLFDLQFSKEAAMLSGGTGIPHEMFEPEVSFEVIPRPGTDFLQRQLRQEPMVDPATGQPMIDPTTGQPIMGPSPVQSYSGIIADEILNGSGNASSAMAKIRQIIAQGQEAGASNDPTDEKFDPQYAALVDSMPTMYDTLGEPQIDWMTAQNDATSWEQAYYEDPRPGPAGAVYDSEGNMISGGEGQMELQYDDAGNQILVKRTEEPTPVMEMFQEYGLPSPYDRYEAADFMGADWEAGMQAFQTAKENLESSKVGLTLQGGITKALEQGANQAQQDYQGAIERWYGNTEYGQRLEAEQEAQSRAGMRGETLPDIGGTRVTTTMAGGGQFGPRFRVPSMVEGRKYPPSYAQPGSSLPEFLGTPFEGEEAEVPETVVKAKTSAAKKKYLADKWRRSYESGQEQYGEQEALVEGAGRELFTADYGRALATELWANQNQQTPYTDALMARRMVPLAAGINTATWVPSG